MKILGINGGNGVILHPLKEYVVGNFEPRAVFHTASNKQWYSNFPESAPIIKDWDLCKKRINKVDVIVGAPDCGHSSILSYSRKKSLGEPKENISLTYYIRAVKYYRPKVFLMENLPALLDTYGKKDLLEAFEGYHIKILRGSMADWGNSQINRERILIVGMINPKWKKKFKRPELNGNIKTCKELLEGLEDEDIELGHVRENIALPFTMYAGFKITGIDAALRWRNELKGKSRWPVENRNFSTAPAVYRNLDDAYPATARKANRQFNSKGLSMSPRELARIQGVPDEFKIYFEDDEDTTYKEMVYWINKGRTTVTKCPPYEIGVWFKECLLKLKPWIT